MYYLMHTSIYIKIQQYQPPCFLPTHPAYSQLNALPKSLFPLHFHFRILAASRPPSLVYLTHPAYSQLNALPKSLFPLHFHFRILAASRPPSLVYLRSNNNLKHTGEISKYRKYTVF